MVISDEGQVIRPDSRSAGWVRLALAVVLLVGVVAVVAWNRQPETARPVATAKSPEQEKARKPVPASLTDPRDTARGRPERERTGRQ